MSSDQSKKYARIKLQLSLFGMVYTCVLLLLLMVSGWSVAFREIATQFEMSVYLVVGCYFLLFTFFFFLWTFPLEVYSSYALEKQFNLSNQTFPAWLGESMKKHLLSFFMMLLLVQVLYFCIREMGGQWWLCVWGFWIFFAVVMARLWPVFILPLFYKTSDLENASLKERLFKFLQSHGIQFKDIYSINLSKTTQKVNAMFCGLGKTRRILLGDNLIEKFTDDEVETVLAHEIGHFKGNHIVKNICISVVTSFVLFWIAQNIFTSYAEAQYAGGINDLAAFPLLNLIAYLLGVVLMPLQNGISRMMEREADDFAFKTIQVTR